MMIERLFSDPAIFILWVLAVVYGLTVHEFSHVFAAYLMGDNTGKQLGRLTLNPLAHIDWLGFLMLLFVGFGWGNPAPYNPYNLKYKKWGSAVVAWAGPLANIISLLVFGLAFKFIRVYSVLSPDNLLLQFLFLLAILNLVLLVFNLIPIPPLDGSRILLTALPDSWNEFKYNFVRFGPLVIIGLVIVDNVILGGVIFNTLFNFILNSIYWLF